MQQSPYEIKEQLLGALDKDYNVVDMETVIYVINVLEKIKITKDALEKTRLGRYINELRKRTRNETLARRAKDLVKSWRKLIPQADNPVNGERLAGGITPPGPGPGCKPSSPALGKAGVRALVPGPTSISRHKPASPLVPSDRIASPLCSSASSSPLLYTVKTCVRAATPSTYAPSKCASSSSSVLSCDNLSVPRQQGTIERNRAVPTSRSLTFKPVSPALIGNKPATPSLGPSPVACPKPHGPVIGSTNSTKPQIPNLNSGKSIPGRFEHENDNRTPPLVVPRPPAPASATNARCTLDLAKTNPANKRLRKESANDSDQSNKKSNVGNPVNSSHALANGMDSAASKHQVDGIRPSKWSAFQSFKSEDLSQDSNSAIDNPFGGGKKKKLKFGALETSEISKEKVMNSRLPKVKTTKQLIEELHAKKGGKMPTVNFPTTSPSVVPVNCRHPSRAGNYALLGSDAETTKTKSELMDRFLKSSPDKALDNIRGISPLTVKMEKTSPNSESYHAGAAAIYVDTISEEIKQLMSSLPSVDPSILDCEEEVEFVPPTRSCGDTGDVQRIFSDQWEHVNGIFDGSGLWCEWQEIASIETLNGDSLHILPYVNIDW